MIILLLCAVWVVGGVALCYRYHWPDITNGSIIGFVSTVVGGVCLLIALSVLPINIMGTKSEIAQFRALEATAQAGRGGEPLEMAAYQMKVAEANQWLADKQYWNGTVFGLWVPDEVDNLTPIR